MRFNEIDARIINRMKIYMDAVVFQKLIGRLLATLPMTIIVYNNDPTINDIVIQTFQANLG